MASDPDLKRIYNWANAEWYGGQLPDDVLVWWEPCGRNAAETVLIEPWGTGEPPQLGIKFCPSVKLLPKYTKLLMGHEQAHVKYWPQYKLEDHGKYFDIEIQRLTKLKSYRKLL